MTTSRSLSFSATSTASVVWCVLLLLHLFSLLSCISCIRPVADLHRICLCYCPLILCREYVWCLHYRYWSFCASELKCIRCYINLLFHYSTVCGSYELLEMDKFLISLSFICWFWLKHILFNQNFENLFLHIWAFFFSLCWFCIFETCSNRK